MADKKGGKKTASKSKSSARGETNPPDVNPRSQTRANKGANFAIPEDFHALYDRGFRSSRGIVAKSVLPLETAGHKRLANQVEGLDVTYDETTQIPNLIISHRAPTLLTAAAPGSPQDAVMQFIRNQSDLWNFAPADLDTIEVVSVSEPSGESREAAGEGATRGALIGETESDFNINNLKTVNLVQRIDGKEVFNSDVTAAVNVNNEVISVAGQFFPGINESASNARARLTDDAESVTSKEEAIARAVFDLTSIAYKPEDFLIDSDANDNSVYQYYRTASREEDDSNAQPVFERPVRVKDVMFPLGEGEFVPAYYMEIWIKGYPAFSYIMDAVDTPDVLYRKNLTSHIAFKYRVHNTGDGIFRPHDGPAPGTPHPTGIPNGFQAKAVKEKLVKIESLLPNAPWLPADARTTDGNNCVAYADLQSPNGFGAGDVKGQITAPQTFDYKYDHTKPAADPNNLQNSVVGMFFHVNWLHDRWYEAGFDEASGNAQKDNFGRGGLGSDPILAEGNDFSGTDNANMATPADGASPRMQMYEFIRPSPLPSRTSNHEALITFHEMGHYITNRLVGNANGLTNPQGRAMGEGWGDFFAICMTSQSTDNFAKGVFAVGGWTDVTPSFKENYYFSIRRFPYSADMNKNPLTFKHIGSNVVLPAGAPISPIQLGANNEVHNAGEVWCAMLWEVFVNLVAKHGHAPAERRMLAYVIGGLKLTPPRPTFTQARDGIITAVSSMSPGDLPDVKRGFAKRGIGTGAVAPPSNSVTLAGVVESFTP
jgi:hypothetical protein